MGLFDNIFKGLSDFFGKSTDDDDEILEEGEVSTASFEGDDEFGFADEDELRAFIKKNGWMTRMSSSIKGREFVKYKGKAEEVAVPEGITTIGSHAFGDGVKRVILPDSVTEIGASAFEHCTTLTAILIPPSVKVIGNNAFYGCTSLKKVTLPAGIKEIPNYTFAYCSSLKEVKLPAGLQTINQYAFKNCTSLEELNIPDTTSFIGNSAFAESGLKSFTLPRDLVNIGSCLFVDCAGITEIRVSPENRYFTSIDGNLYRTSDNTFLMYANGKNDESFTLPEQTLWIGESAFYSCKHLKSVIIPEGIKEIGGYAFKSCDELKEVEIPSTVTVIGEEAFYSCANLESIGYDGFASDWKAIKKRKSWSAYTSKFTVHCLDYDVSKDGKSMTAPTGSTGSGVSSRSTQSSTPASQAASSSPLPAYFVNEGTSTCTVIGRGACEGSTVYIPESINGYTVTHIAKGAFGDSKLKELHIPASVTSIPGEAIGNCSGLTNIFVDSANSAFQSKDGILYSKDGRMLIKYPVGRATYNLVIPEGVTCIGSYAFAFGYTVNSLKLPSTLDTISHWAFAGCGFSEILIPGGVRYVGEFAFASCKNLVQINLPESVENLCKGAFSSCDSLESAKLPSGISAVADQLFSADINLKSIVIPNGVKRIGERAFMNCRKLFSVKLEGSDDPVETIDKEAFYSCTSLSTISIPHGILAIMDEAFAKCDKLHTIYFSSTKSEWSYVHKGMNWACVQGVSCTDGLA